MGYVVTGKRDPNGHVVVYHTPRGTTTKWTCEHGYCSKCKKYDKCEGCKGTK